MARGNETTTKFKVDISELKKAMQDARKQVAYANSEFKEASSSMDDWSKSSDGISAKLKQLNSNLKSQETVLNEYERILEEVKKEYGDNSAEVLEWATKLNNQKAVVNKTKKEIAGYEDALTEVAEAERIASRTGQDVSEVLNDIAKEAEDAGDGFTVLKGTVATFAGNVLTGLVSGLKDAAVNLLGLAESTREYRDQMSKLNSAGTEAGYGVDYVKDKYKDLYGVLGDETATTTTISNFMAMSAEEDTLNSLLNSSIGIWAKYGDSIPLDGLAESINETSKVSKVTGNLADALNWAGINEDDFNAKLEACTSEQERQKLIADTLNSTYGDLSKSYQSSNKTIIDANKANADYTNTMAEMGARIEPVTVTLKTGFTGLLQEILKLVQDVDMEAFTSKIEEGFAVLKDDVLPAVKEGLGWILDNKDALVAGLAAIASGFVAFKVVTIVQGLVSAFKAWQIATKGMTIAQHALNLAMSLNPIGIVIALIAALVAAFIYLWNNSEEFREFWIKLWEKIKEFCSNAIEAIVKFFTETIPEALDKMVTFLKELPVKFALWLLNTINKVIEWRAEMIAKAKDTALNFLNKIIEFIQQLPSKIWTWLLETITKIVQWRIDMFNKAVEIASGFVNKIIEWVKTLPSKVFEWLTSTLLKVAAFGLDLAAKGREAGQNLLDTLVNKVKEIPEKIRSIGSDIVKGLWNGINDMASWIGGKIQGFGEGVLGGIKDFFGINSPSKVMADEVGKWLPEGIAVGITKNAKSTLTAMKDLAMNTVGSARAGLSANGVTGGLGAVSGGGVVNNFTQVINSPKQLSRLDIYRQSKNLLGYAGGGL